MAINSYSEEVVSSILAKSIIFIFYFVAESVKTSVSKIQPLVNELLERCTCLKKNVNTFRPYELTVTFSVLSLQLKKLR